MFCNSCGKGISEGDCFCSNCGNAVWQASEYTEAVEYTTVRNEIEAQPEIGLKWAYFLGYFGLWAGALINIFEGIRCLTGSHYGDDSTLVYAYYDGLKAIDVFYGVCLLVLSVLGGVTAISIIKLKRNAGLLVFAIYIIGAVISMVYVSLFASIVDADTTYLPSAISSIVVSIVIGFASRVYFNNRKHIFVN